MEAWAKFADQLVGALATHGPAPIILGVIAFFGMGALGLGADPFAVVALALIVVVGYVVIEERKHSREVQREREKLASLHAEKGPRLRKATATRLQRTSASGKPPEPVKGEVDDRRS